MRPIDRFLAGMDALDQDLGAHLLKIAERHGAISPGRGREAIVAWCRSSAVARRHREDLINGTAMAAESMDDDMLSYLVNDLLKQARAGRRPTAA